MTQKNDKVQFIKEALWKGKTEMGCLWLMLLVGLLFGWGLKSC